MIQHKLQDRNGFDLHTAQPPLFLQLFNFFKKFIHITKWRGGIFLLLISFFQFQHRFVTLYLPGFSRHKIAPSIHWRSQAVRHRICRHCTAFCVKLLCGYLYSRWYYGIRYSPYPFIHKIQAVFAETLQKWGFIERGSFDGIGKPEPLKGELNGFWSCRIDEVNRLVYRVSTNTLEILSCHGHYEN